MNSKLHAVVDGEGLPLILLLTEGQMNDHKGAKLLFGALPNATVMIGDKGYDSDEFRDALASKGIDACIPPRKGRNTVHTVHTYCKTLYKQRHKVECMFGKLKDWRRIATRYDRCARTYFSAICLAAAVIFYLNQ